MLRYNRNNVSGGAGVTPFSLRHRRKVEEMRTAILVLASMTLALLLASGGALLNAVKSAEATFPGQNGNTMKFIKRGSPRGRASFSHQGTPEASIDHRLSALV